MSNSALAVSGRLVTGETLNAWGFGGPSSTLQWQALVNGVWTNVGTKGSSTYVIPSTASGLSYRLSGTADDGATIFSQPTATVTVDKNKVSGAPVLAGPELAVLATEGAGTFGFFSWLTFSDVDKGNYGGASLLLQDSTATKYGGDGHDALGIRFLGTGVGQFSYNAATREVKYAFTAGTATTIGTIDATLNGNGTDLKLVFNANATQAVVDALIDNLQFVNTDDSPTQGRLLTLRITDPAGQSAQRVTSVHIEPDADAPVFTSPAAFAIDEDQTAVGAVAAVDPDREAGTDQGITYSLVGGTGSADNALFSIDAASGALRFIAAPDFEGPHSPTYSLRVRANDGNGGTVEQVVAVTVRNVNNEPVASDLQATASEDGPSILIAANASDPTPGDTLTYTVNTAGTIGSVSVEGNAFRYDPGSAFQPLHVGATVQDHFQYTVTDAAGHAVTRTVTVAVQGANDVPIAISPFGMVTEAGAAGNGTPVATGGITAFDPDGEAVTFSTDGKGTYGSLTLLANGNWTYILSNASAAVQALGDFDSVTDSIAVNVTDPNGAVTVHHVQVIVWGANDAPVVSDTQVVLAPMVEAGAGVAGTLHAAGNVAGSASDPEGDALHWIAGTQQGQWGALTLDAAGNWHYDVDGARSDPLVQGQRVTDSFVVEVRDSHGASGTRSLRFDVQGSNDVAAISGTTEGHVLEDLAPTLTAAGALSVNDPDAGQSQLVVRTNAVGSAGGIFNVAADGKWTYAIGNDSPAVQSLGEAETRVDTLTVASVDGTAQQVLSVTIHGVNDAATFTGTTTLVALEDNFDADGHLVLAADLGVQDADAGQGAVHPYTGVGSSQLGQFTVDAAGHWTWSSQAPTWSIETLGAGQTLTDTIGVTTDDGSFTLVNVVVTGQNDAPVIAMGDTTGQVVEPGGFPPELPSPPTTATGALFAWDKDSGDVLAWSGSAEGQYGTFTMTPDGHWTYVVDAVKSDPLVMGQSALDTFTATVADDHGGTATQAITITVYGGNEPPVVDSSSTLTGTVHELPAADGTLVIDQGDGSSNAGVVGLDAAGGLLVLGDVEIFPGYSVRALSHFNADGSLDTAYGQDGHTTFQWPQVSRGLQVDAQGRTVAVGYSAANYGATHVDVALARVLADGSLDTSFGMDGVATIDIAGGYEYGEQVFIRADGKLLVTLSAGSTSPDGSTPVALSLDEHGSLDASFGTGGFLMLPPSPQGTQVRIDGEGRILAWSIQADADTGATELHVQRFLQDGSADGSFGGATGIEVPLSPSSVWNADVAVAADGRVVVSLAVPGDGLQHAHAMLLALHADGTPDESFGDHGFVQTPVWAAPGVLQIDGAGRIVLAGQPASALGEQSDFMVVRYLADGTPDASFGNAGAVVTDVSQQGLDDFVIQLAMNADGTLVVSGATSEATYGWDTAIARYTSDGALDTSFGVGIEPTASGLIVANDPDSMPGSWQPLQYTLVNGGTYGNFTLLSPDYGYWTYTLDSSRAATSALGEGEEATDTITVAIRDSFGGVTYQDVTVTVIGAYDPPTT